MHKLVDTAATVAAVVIVIVLWPLFFGAMFSAVADGEHTAD